MKQGGGLLVIGGERNVYVEGKKVEDAMDRTFRPNSRLPGLRKERRVVLIMDKSSSMEGRKMELARLSGIGLIDNLRQTDNVGVLIFDNSFQWAVPIRKSEDRTLIKRLIARRYSRWRYADRSRACGGVSADSTTDVHVSSRRITDRRYLGRRR